MPKENIERAIKRGAGELDGVDYQDVTYEGYGPGGVAVMVQCMTDNRNRTVAEVRHAFSKFGGNLGADGSVAYMFNQVGLLSVEPGANAERVMEIAIDAGAEDVIVNADRSIDVLTDPADYNTVKDAMDHAGLRLELAEVTLRSSVATELGEKEAESMLKLLETLEDLEDVQNVYSNAEIPNDVLARMNGFQG
jgi:YebC/PmpR family DNA-binding regulatory protein